MKNFLMILTLVVTHSISAQTLFVPSGTSGIGLSTNARVGIGTATPAGALGVVVNGDAGLTVTGNSSGFIGSDIYLSRNSSTSGLGRSANIQFDDPSSGRNSMIQSSAGGLQFFNYTSANGWLERLRIDAVTGQVGIGTSDTHARLEVYEPATLGTTIGNTQVLFRVTGRAYNFFSRTEWLKRDAEGWQWWYSRLHDGISIDYGNETPGVNTKTWWERDPMDNIQSWGHADQTYLTINQGNVGIGTLAPDAKLAVNGTIHTKEVRVDMTGWSDYVFDEDYKLLSLPEVSAYINEHHHLPDVPSEKEVLENGQNLGEMNAILLKKVEELTLYLIEQNQKIASMQKTIDRLTNSK